MLYLFTKRYEDSQKVYQRALNIRMRALGSEDPAVAETMNSYSIVLHALHRDAEAAQMESASGRATYAAAATRGITNYLSHKAGVT